MSGTDPDQAVPDLHDARVVSALVANRQAFFAYLVRRLNSRADAEDVLQAFSINVLARSGRLRADDDQGLLAWLYAVLRSTLADHFRAEGRRSRAKLALEAEIAAEPDAGVRDTLFQALCECLLRLMQVMRRDQADLIRQVDLEDGDRSRIAAAMGVTPGTLAVRLHRARAGLRNLLLASCMSCPEHGFDDCACHPDKIETLARIGRR
jgi:RNA polymerase sigma-70 factor (ECF subfamily)